MESRTVPKSLLAGNLEGWEISLPGGAVGDNRIRSVAQFCFKEFPALYMENYAEGHRIFSHTGN